MGLVFEASRFHYWFEYEDIGVKFGVLVDLLTAGSNYEYEDFAVKFGLFVDLITADSNYLKWTESIDFVKYLTSHFHHWNQDFWQSLPVTLSGDMNYCVVYHQAKLHSTYCPRIAG